MRLQFTIDDKHGNQLQEVASHLGFSVSSYVRHLVKLSLSKSNKLNAIDKAMREPSQLITFEELTKQLGLDK